MEVNVLHTEYHLIINKRTVKYYNILKKDGLLLSRTLSESSF